MSRQLIYEAYLPRCFDTDDIKFGYSDRPTASQKRKKLIFCSFFFCGVNLLENRLMAVQLGILSVSIGLLWFGDILYLTLYRLLSIVLWFCKFLETICTQYRKRKGSI